MAWDNIACAANGMSPISSKNNVPLNARSNNPGLFLLPVPTNCSGIDATSIREHFTAQAENPVHMLNWAVRSVKFLGVEFDQSEDEEVSVSDAAHL